MDSKIRDDSFYVLLPKNMGHNITIIIEGLNELEMIIEVLNENEIGYAPNIGLRVRLHSGGSGMW